jgi:hypothetical protein
MPKAPQPKPEPDPDPPEPDDPNDPAVKMTPPQYQEGGSHTEPKRGGPGQNALTFGEKAVGLTFNPSGETIVNELKREYAKIIDLCEMKRQSLMAGSGAHRLWSIAITEAQGAQMWAVKAATWKD